MYKTLNHIQNRSVAWIENKTDNAYNSDKFIVFVYNRYIFHLLLYADPKNRFVMSDWNKSN